MMVVLKFIHVGAIAIWAGGLLMLPWLLLHRAKAGEGERLHQLHRVVRALYTQLASPAAFVAIASGTVLILLRPTQEGWFSAKLVAVGVLAMLHVLHGLVIPSLFQADGSLKRGLGALLATANLTVVVLVLWLVLARPVLPWLDGPVQPGTLPQYLPDWLNALIDRVTS